MELVKRYEVVVFDEPSVSIPGAVVGRASDRKYVIVHKAHKDEVQLFDVWFCELTRVEGAKYWIAKPVYKVGVLGQEVVNEDEYKEIVQSLNGVKVEFGEKHCPEMGIEDWRWV